MEYLKHKDVNAGATESKPGPVHLSMNVLTVHSISQYTAETNSAAWLQHEFFSARVSGSVSLSFTPASLEEKVSYENNFIFFPTDKTHDQNTNCSWSPRVNSTFSSLSAHLLFLFRIF